MTLPETTRPWLDDDAAPPEVRSALAGTRDMPSEAELARLAGRLGPLVGVSAALLVPPAPALAVAPASPVCCANR